MLPFFIYNYTKRVADLRYYSDVANMLEKSSIIDGKKPEPVLKETLKVWFIFDIILSLLRAVATPRAYLNPALIPNWKVFELSPLHIKGRYKGLRVGISESTFMFID